MITCRCLPPCRNLQGQQHHTATHHMAGRTSLMHSMLPKLQPRQQLPAAAHTAFIHTRKLTQTIELMHMCLTCANITLFGPMSSNFNT
eukprot:800816-Pelagomonas_calceolata.AAC.4